MQHWLSIVNSWPSKQDFGSVCQPCAKPSNVSIARVKKTLRAQQATTDRVQKLRVQYWEAIREVELENLVFLDEMGVLLGLKRTHARSPSGARAYDYKPFYRGSKVSVIGAISISKVLAVMTLEDSVNGAAFEVFIRECLAPQLWQGAVVVMDNLPAHKVKAIVPLIEATGAKVIY